MHNLNIATRNHTIFNVLNLRVLLLHFWPCRKLFYTVFFCLVIEAIFYSSVPFSFKFIVDDLLLTNKQPTLLLILSCLFGGFIVTVMISLWREYLYATAISIVLSNVRVKIFNRLHSIPVHHVSKSDSGDFLSYFSNDLTSIENAAMSAVSWAVAPILSIIISFILLTILNWQLTLFAALALSLMFILPRKIAVYLQSRSLERRQKIARLLSTIQENIVMQLVVRAFSLSAHLKSGFLKEDKQLTETITQVNFLSSLMERSGEISALFLQILFLGIGSYMVHIKALSIGSLVSFQAIFTVLTYSLTYVIVYSPKLVQGLVSMGQIQEFFNQFPVKNDPHSPALAARFSKELAFNSVNFHYETKLVNFDNVSFTIQKGTSVAFIGPSGCGKSTILSLIMGFYSPTSGTITLDGVDLQKIDLNSFLFLTGYVFQENLLFNISVRENIRMGNVNASDWEVENAAIAAEIHDSILAMSDGYDTFVGERGTRLSGGQRQRIAIARAILRNPEIFILDEATSALDSSTEMAINTTLNQLIKGRTSITVTHRLTTVIGADCIFVMKEGKICERGSHQSLLSQNGFYKQLWDKQHGFIINAEEDEVIPTVERLQLIELFNALPRDFLENSIPLFKTVICGGNQLVMQEGDSSDLFYIIVRGKVSIEKSNKNFPVTVLTDGDYFGEVALLREISRTATVKTVTRCVFLTLQRQDFMQLLKRSPELQQRLEIVVQARIDMPY